MDLKNPATFETQMPEPLRSPIVPGCFELPWAFLVRLDALPCDVFVKTGSRATLYALPGYSPTTLAERASNGATFLVRSGDMAALRRGLVGALDRTLADDSLPPITRSKTAYAIAAAIAAPTLAGSDPSPEDIELVRDTVEALTNILLSAPEEIWRMCTVLQGDSRMHTHAVNVAVLSLVLAREVGVSTVSDLQAVGVGGLLHDLGKMRLPKHVIDREEPSAREEQIIRMHPSRGMEMLRANGQLPPFARIVGEHHERYDGTGYPNHVGGESISLGGRMVAIVDGFESRTQGPKHARDLSPFDALNAMRADAGAYDAELLRQFIGSLGGRNLLRRRAA